MRAVTDLPIKKGAVGGLLQLQGGAARPHPVSRSLPFFVYVCCLHGARALFVRDVVAGASETLVSLPLADHLAAAFSEAPKKVTKPVGHTGQVHESTTAHVPAVHFAGIMARTRVTWLFWLLSSIFATSTIFFAVLMCFCYRDPCGGSSRQLKEDPFAMQRASLLAAGPSSSSGALVPLPPLRMGWVPDKECCLTVFREWLATHRDSANFKVKNLDGNKIPMQASVLYTARRLTMFAEPHWKSPCCVISPPAQQLVGKDPTSSTPVLEVRDHDGDLYAILEVEAKGTYSLRRGGNCLMSIESSGGNLVVVSGTVQIGKVTCRAWERIEGELVEIWSNAGTDATIIVGVVLAVLLLIDGNAAPPEAHENLSPRLDLHQMSLAPSRSLPGPRR